MKTFTSVLLAFFSIASIQASTPEELKVPISDVFSPLGFDTNDSTEVVISGFMPNLCHRSPRSTVKIEGSKILVTMTSLYYEESSPFCPKVIMPFVETVNVGLLDKGNYEVIVNENSRYEKKSEIFVAESRSDAVDNFIYAGVEYIEKNVGMRVVQLKGYNPSDCFVLDEIQTVSNKKDTLAILPILKQVSDYCPMKMTPFTYEYVVPTELKAENVLLHVRSMDGRSVNSVFNNL